MTHNTLHLAYLTSQAPLDEFDIKERQEGSSDGIEFNFTVIGNSHYIEAPKLDFYELFSCEPISSGLVKTFNLETGITHTVRHEADRYATTTYIEGQPLSDFPSPDTFDITYQFGPRAYTTIDFRDTDPTYETYHTYPEYDLALYTENKITSCRPSTTRSLPGRAPGRTSSTNTKSSPW